MSYAPALPSLWAPGCSPPASRSASFREMAQRYRPRRAPVKTAQGPYPRRALSRPGGGPQRLDREVHSRVTTPVLVGIVSCQESFRREIHDWYLQSPDAGPTAQGNNPPPPPERSVGRYPARATAFGLNRVHYSRVTLRSWAWERLSLDRNPKRWTTSAVEKPEASRQLQCDQCFVSVYPPEIPIRFHCRVAAPHRIVGCYLGSKSTGWVGRHDSETTRNIQTMVCGSSNIELSVAISIPRRLAGAETIPNPCHDRSIHGRTWRLEEGEGDWV